MPPETYDATMAVNVRVPFFAAVVDFLVSDAASFITCATIDVNGGA